MQEFFSTIGPYWIWLGLACLFLAVEVLIVPTGLFLCLGTSAGLVAILTFVMPDLSWMWAVTVFSALMVIAGYGWWRFMRRKSEQKSDAETEVLSARRQKLLGYRGVLEEDTVAGRSRMRVNDSAWPVSADADYPAGTHVEVVDVKGITLVVRALDSHYTESA